MRSATDHQQTMQRIKVGMIGLAAVVLLIAIASTILGSVTRERPIATAGAAQADVVANMSVTNDDAAASEPLAEMGVAPATANMQDQTTEPVAAQDARQPR